MIGSGDHRHGMAPRRVASAVSRTPRPGLAGLCGEVRLGILIDRLRSGYLVGRTRLRSDGRGSRGATGVASRGCLFFAQRMGPGGLLPDPGMITWSGDHAVADLRMLAIDLSSAGSAR